MSATKKYSTYIQYVYLLHDYLKHLILKKNPTMYTCSLYQCKKVRKYPSLYTYINDWQIHTNSQLIPRLVLDTYLNTHTKKSVAKMHQ